MATTNPPSSPRLSLAFFSRPSSSYHPDSDLRHSSSSGSGFSSRPQSHVFRQSVAMPVNIRDVFSSPPRTRAMSASKPGGSGFLSLNKKPGQEGSVLNTLKHRLKKRPSAPLLSKFSPSLGDLSDDPTTPTSGGGPSKVTRRPSLDHLRVESLDADENGSSSRKPTPTAVMVIGRVGFGLQEGPSPEDEMENPHDVYEKTTWFSNRENMKVHPFPRNEVKYMQAYNGILLDNDRHFNTLLNLLNDNGTPTFYDYNKSAAGCPPQTVLDLGCGEGVWAIQAANHWKNTQVIGLDIVNLVDKHQVLPPNVSFKKGNFVEFDLPFPSESFDLVRLSNMTLGIPQDRWHHVLCEIRRVLTPGGRLELVDDEITFPYESKIRAWGHASSRPNSTMSDSMAPSLTATSSFNIDLDSDIPELSASSRTSGSSWEKHLPPTPRSASEDAFSISPEGVEYFEGSIDGLSMENLLSTIDQEIKRNGGIHDTISPVEEVDDEEQEEEVTEDSVNIEQSQEEGAREETSDTSQEVSVPSEDSKDTTPTPLDSKDQPNSPENPLVNPWSHDFSSCNDIEQIFVHMLKSVYGIDLAAHAHLGDMIASVFGKSNTEKIRSMHLSLPAQPEESSYSPTSSSEGDNADLQTPGGGRKWTLDWDTLRKKDKNSLLEEGSLQLQVPAEAKINAKAAKLLGVSLSSSSDLPSLLEENSDFSGPLDSSASDINPFDTHPLPDIPLSSRPHSAPLLSAGSGSSKMKPKYDPKGLILYPDVFLEMPPCDLDMHVTKNMHVLLGCKAALSSYVGTFKREDGERLVSEEEFEEMMWNYECLRRKRFRLPELICLNEAQREDEKSQGFLRLGSRRIQGRQRSGSVSKTTTKVSRLDTKVRAIRVFQAFKQFSEDEQEDCEDTEVESD